jgi:pimeloyl-ACP methyl ester carboxylesterase
VLVAHGYCGFRTNYEYLSVPLASWGFLVAAPDFPGINRADCDAGVPPGDILGDPPRDLEFLRGAVHDRSGPARALAPFVRGRRAGLVGHSLGGAAVVRASLADPDLTAVVALAAVAGSAQGQPFQGLRPRRAVLVAGGTADTTILFDRSPAPFFAALPAPGVPAEGHRRDAQRLHGHGQPSLGGAARAAAGADAALRDRIPAPVSRP